MTVGIFIDLDFVSCKLISFNGLLEDSLGFSIHEVLDLWE